MKDHMVQGPAAQNTGNNLLILGAAPMDVSSYASIMLQVISTAGVSAGVIAFEQSVDGVNGWVPMPLYDMANINVAPVNNFTVAASVTRVFVGNIAGKYIRLRASTVIAGGTVTLAALLSELDFVNPVNNMSVIGSAAVTIAATIGTNALGVATTNGCTNQRALSAASTNSTLVKASAGRIFSLIVSNTTASNKFLKLYNKATAPTVGTDVPYLTVLIPANTSLSLVGNPLGIYFSTGIGFGITGLVADADTTAVAVGDVSINIQYA